MGDVEGEMRLHRRLARLSRDALSRHWTPAAESISGERALDRSIYDSLSEAHISSVLALKLKVLLINIMFFVLRPQKHEERRLRLLAGWTVN